MHAWQHTPLAGLLPVADCSCVVVAMHGTGSTATVAVARFEALYYYIVCVY
jgi:hypothetical protein